MDDGFDQVGVPAFRGKQRKIRKGSAQAPAGKARRRPEESLSARRRSGSRRKRREMKGEEEDVERKIVALQRIVPGGEALGVDKLFDETAEYILALQCQIKAMRVLASFLEGLEKESRKFGG